MNIRIGTLVTTPPKISIGDEHAYQKSAGAGQVSWLSVLAHPGK